MSIETFENSTPTLAENVYVHKSAVIVGNVTIGKHSSVWPQVVVRADINKITIGEYTNLQDGTVVHVTHAGKIHPDGFMTEIGNNVVIGHRVILHGCTINNFCLVGINSTVMDGAVIEDYVMLGAGSLVPPGKVLRSGYLYFGSPVKKVRQLTNHEREFIEYSAKHYANLAERYQHQA